MDNSLDGFEVIENMPVVARNRTWDTRRILDAFLDSGETCLGKRYGDDAKKAYIAFRANARQRHMPVTVCKRGDMVILVLKEGGDD